MLVQGGRALLLYLLVWGWVCPVGDVRWGLESTRFLLGALGQSSEEQ